MLPSLAAVDHCLWLQGVELGAEDETAVEGHLVSLVSPLVHFVSTTSQISVSV